MTPQRPASGDFLLGSPCRLALAMETSSVIVGNEFEPLLADDDWEFAAETI